MSNIRSTTLNFGPQHPAAHGILRLTIELQGEVIRRLDPQFGLLHRGTEKLMEIRSYLQNLPYMDRFDYVANIISEHSFCLAVEQLCLFNVNFVSTLVRCLFDELSRILNHLLTLSAVALDLGAMGPIFWAFEERERIMELLERATGARMHTAIYKPMSVDLTPLNKQFFLDLAILITKASRALSGAFLGLLNNRALKTRLAYVGSISPQRCFSYGITGIISRSTGINMDLRLQTLQNNLTYGPYWTLTFRSFTTRRGDNWDRHILRVKEVLESFRLIAQVSSHLTKWSTKINTSKFSSMEAIINHFQEHSLGLTLPRGYAYGVVESPKGEVGISLISDGSTKPYRIKLRSPVSHNMHLVNCISVGLTLADFVATFCSLDIVLGEIDK